MQWLPLSRHSAQTSPGTTRFFLSIHPLHLPYMIPCSYRASACKAVLPSCIAFYVISVRQTGDLPVVSLFPHPASFRFHLAMDTLTFGYILPTTGRIRDLHPLETCAAGRTFIQKAVPNLFFENCFLILSVLCQLFPVPPSKVPTEYPCPNPHNRPYNVPHRSDQAPSACRTAFFRPVSDRRDFPGSIQQARPHSTPDAACGYVRT